MRLHPDRLDPQGYPLATLIPPPTPAPLETCRRFGKRLYGKPETRWGRAERKCYGRWAEWIWNLAEQHFPGAIQIVESLSRALNTCGNWCAASIPTTKGSRNLDEAHQRRCYKGKIEKLVGALRSILLLHPKWSRKIRIELTTSRETQPACAIPSFAASTSLSARGDRSRCKTVVGSRLNNRGCSDVRGANAIVALRCSISTAALRYWKRAKRPDLHFYVAHPGLVCAPQNS